MRGVDTVVDAVMDHSRVVIAVMLVLTVAIGSGAVMVEQTSSLDQFQTDSPESDALEYIQENFSTGEENTTTAQVIQRDEDVFDEASLVGMLEYQQTLRENETVNATLSGNGSTTSIANVVATAAITAEEGEDVQRTAAELRALNESVSEERAAIRERNETLSRTAGLLRDALTTLRGNPDASVGAEFAGVRANTSVELDEEDAATFERAAERLRNASTEAETREAYRLGTRGVLEDQYAALRDRSAALREDVDRLRELDDELATERRQYENASNATIEEQREQLRSMNESAIHDTVRTVLGEDAGGNGGDGLGPFALMPTSYDPGTTEANATMLIVTMEGEGAAATGAAGEDVIDAQLAMQTLGERAGGGEYLVFGAGVISHEITSSMTDSLLIVGPLAVLFVLIALAVAYRDVLDILLGLFGIGAVLAWTFGFMGWTDIAFNQIFIAVPVLLIGLSIDYAIHIFMRHREERANGGGDGPRGSMRTALVGVGIALLYVTATTVIGFLSNLTSPVPPIREFGIVSSAGITAALLVFGLLIPAMKVEVDDLLESRGIDRRKRAFGTGGGAFSSVLSVGAIAARKGPYLVIVFALVLSVAGGYGATQVDTSFEQSDFIAEDPADWMKELPEPFAPGDYTAKANLEYVNDNFLRQDSQAQILIRPDGGDLTDDDVLRRIAAAEATAVDKENVTQTLSNGEPRIRSPLSVMESVAERNDAFAERFAAADANDDGVPDRNLEALYDELFEVAPDGASEVIDRDDGEYTAAQITISVQGGASGDAVTEAMRDVADEVDGEGLRATATGGAVLNTIVQDQLLETVVESLVITLVATFVFLMIAYRITEGSASLGAVTLLPVGFSVTWILGTMYLLDIPFNVITGMITSLTVGLGVAYSIHLSERYNQELERTGEIWTAMERAVTGTGGALLGSAATTVGGFGVLVFAILPPLQQFGQITGLTIVYAFLASVLVLPSLLAVWTRFVGPDGVFPEPTDGEDGGDEGPAGASDSAPGGTVDGAPRSAPEGAVVGPRAERRFDRSVVGPDGTVTVTIETEGVDGRAVVYERVDGTPTVESATPEPVRHVEADGVLSVALEGENPTLRYTTTVPGNVADGETIAFDGAVSVDGEPSKTDGEYEVAVVSDVFERVTASGSVSAADLADAYDGFERGELTEAQLSRINQAWTRGRE
ncbi:MMPL family transporter [Halorubrum sodomense]|uniref:Predicted exporter protein, RND superfamily n=1 Tax=Halorubrum sodomense TaxID=35743 RepID=A0A1I6FK84_HALSD|nr:MMPL family transporter [Halorubrum sodomense]SFR30366.1 Predicted exporter protein, RND superfamily [Halorubrum sodomense]